MTQLIKRVVVSLDAVSEADPAIDTAARLAARWRVPLHGVFIEDEELIEFAGLPFARQVTLAGLEPLTKDHIEDHFRAFAERLQRQLAAAAARHGVEWSFEVVRGPLAAAALGDERDFVVAGAATRPVRRAFPDRIALVVVNSDHPAPLLIGAARLGNRRIDPHPPSQSRPRIGAGARHRSANRRLLQRHVDGGRPPRSCRIGRFRGLGFGPA